MPGESRLQCTSATASCSVHTTHPSPSSAAATSISRKPATSSSIIMKASGQTVAPSRAVSVLVYVEFAGGKTALV